MDISLARFRCARRARAGGPYRVHPLRVRARARGCSLSNEHLRDLVLAFDEREMDVDMCEQAQRTLPALCSDPTTVAAAAAAARA